MQANWGLGPVYITRQMRIAGCCVLAESRFSQGSLAPIGYSVNGAGVLVSEILATYQTDAAMKRSADSYGGINTKSVYLNPTSSISSFVDSSSLAGGGSSTGSDTAGGEPQNPGDGDDLDQD